MFFYYLYMVFMKQNLPYKENGQTILALSIRYSSMRVSITLKVYPQMTFDASLSHSLSGQCDRQYVVEVDFGMWWNKLVNENLCLAGYQIARSLQRWSGCLIKH